jgi:hypothetical protein
VISAPTSGWYADPSRRAGLRCWNGGAWTDDVTSVNGIAALAKPLLVLAAVFVAAGSLLALPQAFGIAMMNFDDHLVNTGPVLSALFGSAGVAILLFVGAAVLASPGATVNNRALSGRLSALAILLELGVVSGINAGLAASIFG